MGREPLPDDAVIWEQYGRTFVRLAHDMYIYEFDEDGRLERVAFEDLPARPDPQPGIERLRRELERRSRAGERR